MAARRDYQRSRLEEPRPDKQAVRRRTADFTQLKEPTPQELADTRYWLKEMAKMGLDTLEGCTLRKPLKSAA